MTSKDQQSESSVDELFSLPGLPPVEIRHIESPSTAVIQLLKSNDAPLPVQLTTIQERYREAEEVHMLLNDRLVAMRAELDRTLARQDEVAAVMQTYKRILHPIRRIPAEVLIEIFSYCIENVDISSFLMSLDIDSLDTKRAPWNLGQVCKYWRSVVVGAPQLWSSITLNLSKISHKDPAKLRRMEAKAALLLSQRLTRTKNCALEVAIASTDGFHPLLSHIYSHSSRWRRAIVSLPRDAFEQLSSIKGCLSSLQELYVQSSDADMGSVDWGGQVIDAFEYAPKLISVTTHNIPPVTSIILPWAQLEDWHDGSIRQQPWHNTRNDSNLALLKKCTNLMTMATTCELSLPPESQRVRHTCLQSLTISWSSPAPIEQCLDSVTLPALEDLHIYAGSVHNRSPELSMRSIWELIQRSDCSVMTLRLHGFDTHLEHDGACCRALLTSTESLQYLAFSDIKNSFSRGLLLSAPESLEPTERVLVPNLRALALPGRCPPSLNQLLLVEMLESRVKYGKLKQAEIKSSFRLSQSEAITRFDKLVEARIDNTRRGWTLFNLRSPG